MNNIKLRLKQLRMEKGLTMSEFAKLISVSPGNVGDWESENRTSIPTAKALIAIAKTFHVSLDWLLLGQTIPSSTLNQSHAHAENQANTPQEALLSPLIELFQSLPAEDRQLIIALASRLAHFSKAP